MLTEILLVDLVEGPEVAGVIEPHATAHHMLQPVAGLVQNGDDIGDGLVRLLDNAARNDLPVFHRHLAGDIEPAIGLDSAGKRQPLATGPRLLGPVTLDRHGHLSCKLFSSIVDKRPQKTDFDQTKSTFMKRI